MSNTCTHVIFRFLSFSKTKKLSIESTQHKGFIRLQICANDLANTKWRVYSGHLKLRFSFVVWAWNGITAVTQVCRKRRLKGGFTV